MKENNGLQDMKLTLPGQFFKAGSETTMVE